MALPEHDREPSPWLPLLRQLTDVCATWLVYKQVDAALAGDGDIDSAAADDEWPRIEKQFRQWAATHGLGPVAVCHHIPGGLNLIAVPDHMSTFLELSAKRSKVFRGSNLFDLEDLLPLAEMDPRGFRRVRPGAEGVLKMVLNGSKWGGRPNFEGLEAKNVAALLRQDPEGVRLAVGLFGVAARPALALSRAVEHGGWHHAAMLAVEARALGRSLARPGVLVRRARFHLADTQSCPIVRAILTDRRRIPDDRQGWLKQVAASHTVHW